MGVSGVVELHHEACLRCGDAPAGVRGRGGVEVHFEGEVASDVAGVLGRAELHRGARGHGGAVALHHHDTGVLLDVEPVARRACDGADARASGDDVLFHETGVQRGGVNLQLEPGFSGDVAGERGDAEFHRKAGFRGDCVVETFQGLRRSLPPLASFPPLPPLAPLAWRAFDAGRGTRPRVRAPAPSPKCSGDGWTSVTGERPDEARLAVFLLCS